MLLVVILTGGFLGLGPSAMDFAPAANFVFSFAFAVPNPPVRF
jgi:hypothetical protein